MTAAALASSPGCKGLSSAPGDHNSMKRILPWAASCRITSAKRSAGQRCDGLRALMWTATVIVPGATLLAGLIPVAVRGWEGSAPIYGGFSQYYRRDQLSIRNRDQDLNLNTQSSLLNDADLTIRRRGTRNPSPPRGRIKKSEPTPRRRRAAGRQPRARSVSRPTTTCFAPTPSEISGARSSAKPIMFS
mgnify:CR=1 FL=1